VADLDDALDQPRLLGVEVDAGDEGAVDLQLVDGEGLEVAERRVAGAEVVDTSSTEAPATCPRSR
jgi:hypothetical protein